MLDRRYIDYFVALQNTSITFSAQDDADKCTLQSMAVLHHRMQQYTLVQALNQLFDHPQGHFSRLFHVPIHNTFWNVVMREPLPEPKFRAAPPPGWAKRGPPERTAVGSEISFPAPQAKESAAEAPKPPKLEKGTSNPEARLPANEPRKKDCSPNRALLQKSTFRTADLHP
eukprot:s7479_g2.t1